MTHDFGVQERIALSTNHRVLLFPASGVGYFSFLNLEDYVKWKIAALWHILVYALNRYMHHTPFLQFI